MFTGILELSPPTIFLVIAAMTLGSTIYAVMLVPDSLMRFLLWMLTHTLYRVRVVGSGHIPEKGGALFVCNHLSFMDACFLMEDGKGFLTVAALPDKRIVGWAFILNSGSPMEIEKPTFDFELHPNYSSSANLLIRETLRIARELRISSTCSWCSAAAKDKVDVLKKEGFKELSRIPSYCAENGRKSDMLILQEGGIPD